MQKPTRLATCVLASTFSLYCLPTFAAALMGFADSAMLMTEVGRYNQEWMLNYSPSVGQAFGVEQMRLSAKGEAATTLTGLNYTGLLKRWNGRASQANLWINGGIGEARGLYHGLAYSPGVQLDYETTRLYFLAKARMLRAPEMQYDMAAVQAGVSLFEASYEETQPWLVLEVKSMRNTEPNLQITPAIRLINKRYFLELGVTNPGQGEGFAPRLNAMFVF